MSPRNRPADLQWHVGVQEVLRYGRNDDPSMPIVGDMVNFQWLRRPPHGGKGIILEAGINTTAAVVGPDGEQRVPVIALRSSPWKAGQESNPWHDEFDLDHGHIRYFGDHKVSTLGEVGATRGNRALINAWRYHASGELTDRILAAPILMFRSVPVWVEGRRVDKGHVDFAGACIMERLEYIVQRDPQTGKTFPNLAIDLDVIRLDQNDELDFRWVFDRQDPSLTAEEALRNAPDSWRDWVSRGRVALPRVRRRVLSSRVLSAAEQRPEPGSELDTILQDVYRAFDDRKHAFEWLASRVAEHVLSDGGARYSAGWLTKAGGDGGMDFVGRLDVGSTSAGTPLVVLGQAKCVLPSTNISPDQVARVVARLRRGWIGVFVTTGVFSQQAQVEVVDDEYPVVLVGAKSLAQAVQRIAAESYAGDVSALLQAAITEYEGEVTHRRPAEVLSIG